MVNGAHNITIISTKLSIIISKETYINFSLFISELHKIIKFKEKMSKTVRLELKKKKRSFNNVKNIQVYKRTSKTAFEKLKLKICKAFTTARMIKQIMMILTNKNY